MGQKINPNIFRLGINKTWKTEFFEKKNKELPLYTFKDLEIKAYIERFLETHGIILHDYKQHYSNSTLNLYVSYFVTSEFMVPKIKSTNLLLINKEGNKKKVDTSFKTNTILNSVFKVLNLFIPNKSNIIMHLNCINKDLNFLKVTQKKNFISLQRFRNTTFLKEGIELLFHVVCNKNSANLLARFIAFQIQKIKRHKFFLSFLKKSLTAMMNSSVSQIKGVKIIVKGRLNGVPRAKHKILTIGDVPVQKISEKVNYAQTAVHNSNGSYGIKVWVVEKT